MKQLVPWNTLQVIHSLLIIFSCTQVIVSSTVNGNKNVGKLLTRKLLENFLIEKNITGMHCWIRFLFEESHTDSILIDWSTIANYGVPLKFFYEVTNPNLTKYIYIPANSKFNSNCWFTVITVKSLNFLSIKTMIGHPTRDHFIFMSKSESLLSNVMSSSYVLNGYSRKYGIFPDAKLNSVGYIVYPPYFTGKVATQSSLKIPQEINIFNGRAMRVAYLQISPYFFGSSNSQLDGMQYILVTVFAARTNQTVIFYDNLKSPGYGRLMNNGAWTGLVGEIVEGRADMAPTLGHNLQRFGILDMAKSSYIEPFVMCLELPKPYRGWHALVDPLTPFVWLCTFFTFILITLIFSVKITSQDKCDNKGVQLILSIYGIFMEQSTPVPEKNPSRFLLIIWILFSYWIGTAYKTNLVTFLTFSGTDKIPETFQQLYEDSRYSIMLHSVGGMELNILKESRNPVMQGISSRMTIEKSVLTCLHNAAQSKSACLGWRSYFITAIGQGREDNFKDLFISENWGSFIWAGSVFKKWSILTQPFNRYVEITKAASLWTFWEQRTLQKIKQTNMKVDKDSGSKLEKVAPTTSRFIRENDTNHSLNTSDVLIIFWVAVVGNLLALICFISELINYKYKKIKKVSFLCLFKPK